MLLTDQLKEYIQAQIGYDAENTQLKEAKKEFRALFMERTGATKSELKMIDSAIKVNMKLDTEFEINEFVTNVQKVSDFFNKAAPGNEDIKDEENPILTHVEERAPEKVTSKSLNENWNPPKGPVIPTGKK